MHSRREMLAAAAASAAAASGQAHAAANMVLPTDQSLLAPARRKAAMLSIGVSRFGDAPVLDNALEDSALITQSFSALGFDTYILNDPSHDDLLLALARFRTLIADSEIAVIYVAGHGAYVGDTVHVFPTDTDIRGSQIHNSIPENVFVHTMSDLPRHKILLLDCCRSQFSQNSYKTSADPAEFGGLFKFYATQRGAEAFDGTADGGPFASSLARHLRLPGLSLDEIALRTRLDVLRETGGAQIPWNSSSLLTRLVLNQA